MDIRTVLTAIVIIAVLIGLYIIWSGIGSIQSGRSVYYFKERRRKINYGWSLLLLGGFFMLTAVILGTFGDELSQRYVQPAIPEPPQITSTSEPTKIVSTRTPAFTPTAIIYFPTLASPTPTPSATSTEAPVSPSATQTLTPTPSRTPRPSN